MRADRRWTSAIALLVATLGSPLALAADAGAPRPSAVTDAGAPNPHTLPTPHAGGGGNGTEADEGDEGPADPHGQGAGKPHAGGPGSGADGMFQPPEDGAVEDPLLPTGTLDVQIVDPTGKPLPGSVVTVGILNNSVAKGESRKRVTATADGRGIARLDHLENGSTVAYRPMVITEGATFSVMPFRLPERGGMKALLHVYPVVEAVEAALVVTQSVLYAEVKDDRIQIQQAFKIYNFGKTAWVPKDLVIALPPEFTAFTTQQGMTDVGVDAVPKQGVRVHGTFPPGQHMVEFRWQLPYTGEAEIHFDVGMAPHLAAARVIAPASKDMRLEVPGFPPPQSTNDGMGQRALVTEKQIRREESTVKSVTVIIKGLPTEGPAKLVATLLSAGGLVMGLVLGTRKPAKRDRKIERDRLLAEIEELERALTAGEVGPRTYERARSELVDAVARTFADEGPLPTKKGRAERS